MQTLERKSKKLQNDKDSILFKQTYILFGCIHNS